MWKLADMMRGAQPWAMSRLRYPDVLGCARARGSGNGQERHGMQSVVARSLFCPGMCICVCQKSPIPFHLTPVENVQTSKQEQRMAGIAQRGRTSCRPSQHSGSHFLDVAFRLPIPPPPSNGKMALKSPVPTGGSCCAPTTHRGAVGQGSPSIILPELTPPEQKSRWPLLEPIRHTKHIP